MAKLNAPLFSFAASGKIANALVYFGWKGLNVVRKYVVPANPNTTAQSTHRAYLTAAVAKIHATQGLATNPLDQVDQTAYAALGSTHATPRTWFNEICKLWIDVKVAVEVPCIYSSVNFVSKVAAAMSINLFLNEETGSTLTHGKFYFGTSKTNLVNSTAADIIAGVAAQIIGVDLSAFLTAGVKYFVQFRPDVDKPCEGADSGIYYFTAE